jgi:hypothetical protein
MNKIKIYFFPDWVYIAPPWAIAPASGESPVYAKLECNHDIAIDLVNGFVHLKIGYMTSCKAGEARSLSKMLEYAADICSEANQYIYYPTLLKAYLPNADVYIVER